MDPKIKKKMVKTLRDSLPEFNPRIRLGRELGEGLTSVVYEISGCNEVVKISDTRCIAPGDTNSPEDVSRRRYIRERFAGEAAALTAMKDSLYVVDVVDHYEYVFPEERRLREEEHPFRSQFFLRMPRLTPLNEYLPAHPSERVLIRMAMDMCSAFRDCARQDIIHRDVKPGNIFVDTSGGASEPRFLLGDFGFSRRMRYENAEPVSHVGTPGFIAPEIMENYGLDGRLNVDIYSLGVTLFYLVSHGSFPPDFISRKGKLRSLPKISPEFAQIILNAIQPNPGNRYQTAQEMLSDLSALTGDETRRVVEDYAFLEAKQAILRGNLRGAEEISRRGYQKEKRKDCLRLLAYCRYRQNQDDPDSVRSVKQILETLAYEGDAVARYIRASIHGKEKEFDLYANNLRVSAEEGCVVAQSRYGRHLYTGELDAIAQDTEKGMEYLWRAAVEGYLPALRFLTEERAANPDFHVPDPSMLDEFAASGKLDRYQEKWREDIIRFL